jgi:hypothetical protein
MATRIILFLDVVLTGLIAGIIFGIVIGSNPAGLSAQAYVEQQQNAIRSMNVLMPVLGVIAIALTGTLAFLLRRNRNAFWALLAAAALLIFSGAVTRFGNQPINAIVIQWSVDSIPDNWTGLRDTWWKYHTWRTMASVISFCLLAWIAIRPKTFR